MDFARFHGPFDGAVVFVGVGAVGELAVGDVGDELDEKLFELVSTDGGQVERANAGGIDHVAAAVEAKQPGRRGRVPPLAERLDDLSGRKL